MENEELMKILNGTLSQIDEKYNQIAKSYNLTFNMLMYIYTVEEADIITQKDVCDVLLLQKSSVNSITNKFIHDGYIVLESGKNRKEKNIVKTECGKIFFHEVFKTLREMESNLLLRLTASDKDKLVSICKKVIL